MHSKQNSISAQDHMPLDTLGYGGNFPGMWTSHWTTIIFVDVGIPLHEVAGSHDLSNPVEPCAVVQPSVRIASVISRYMPAFKWLLY